MDFRKADRFRGINNRLPPDRLRQLGDREEGAFVADAVNVDLTDAGSFQRRPGRTRVGTDTACRGLYPHAGALYYAAGRNIRRFDGANATTVGQVGSPLAEVEFLTTPRGLICSDGFRLQLLEGQPQPLVPDTPNPIPLPAVIGGGLPAGQYGVSFAAETDQGVRSAMSYPLYFSVPEGGGVQFTQGVRNEAIAVFLTTANGEVFYRAGTLAPGQTSLAVATHAADGEPVVYEWCEPTPAGQNLEYHRGRLLVSRGNILNYSKPFELGLHCPRTDYILMSAPITLVASVDEGLFVCTAEETWFFGGGDLRQANAKLVAPFGAVRGTKTRVPQQSEWMWFTERGPVLTEGTGIKLLQDDRIAYAPAQAGAGIVREDNGLRTFITALSGASPSAGAVAGSFMTAEVIS